MNCKPGDLAYIVAPAAERCRGAIVRVEAAAREEERLLQADGILGIFRREEGEEGPTWICSGRVPAPDGRTLTRLAILDACLRPIVGPEARREVEDEAAREKLAHVYALGRLKSNPAKFTVYVGGGR